jgi:hypothetical protein
MSTRIALTAVSVITTIMLATVTPGATTAAPSAGERVVDRFLHPEGPILTTYQAHRVLEASTMGGRMQARVEALTSVDNQGHFHYTVLRESGSSLIREHVLLKALETEGRSHEPEEQGRAALTPDNYAFTAGSVVADGLVAIGLRPHKPHKMLLNGIVLVQPETGEIARLDGSLSDNPSWWTRHVDISRRYGRIAGVSVPLEMSSHADIRVAGDSDFRMTYSYSMVNGVAVRAE